MLENPPDPGVDLPDVRVSKDSTPNDHHHDHKMRRTPLGSMRFSLYYHIATVLLSLTVVLTNAFANSRGAATRNVVSEQSLASRRQDFRLQQQPPENDPDQPVLVRVTTLLVEALTRPTVVASLPSGVLLALVALPVVAPLSQTVLTFILFLALAILGRLAGVSSSDYQVEQASGDDDEKENTSWTDVFALVFAASTAYLVLPSSLGNLDAGLLTGPVVGIGLLGATVAVLWQTTTTIASADEKDKFEGKVNGVSAELFNKWDEEMKLRELPEGKKVQEKEDE